MTAPLASRPRAPVVGAAFVLLLLLFAAFWPVVVGRRSFFHSDLYYEHLPVWAASQRALRSGEFPTWIEGEYCGHPPLFHQEAPLFYPPMVPLLLTGAPVHRLADLFTLFHIGLAGFTAFLLVRELTGRPLVALFGGVAWMLSARMVQSVLWSNAVAVSSLVPLLLFGLCRIANGRRRSGVLWAAASGGLALLAARPHVLLSAAPLVVAVAAALLWTGARRGRMLADFGLAAVLALALGAPSVLPTALLLPETARSSGLPANAPDFQPLGHGRELDMVFLPVAGRMRWPESAAYAGVLAYLLFLAAIPLGMRRDERLPRAVFAACALGGTAGLILAFGGAGPYRYLAELPLIRGFRIPERFLFSWSLAIAIGSALGLSWLARGPRRRLVAAVCLAGLAGDLVWQARRTAPTAEADLYEVEPAVVGRLRARLGDDALGFPRRYYSVADTIHPVYYDDDAARRVMIRDFEPGKWALALRFGLESAGGYGPTLARTEEFLAALNPQGARMAGVGAIVASVERSPGEPTTQARRLRIEDFAALPRAILVPEAIVVPANAAVGVALGPGIDPQRTAVLEEGEPLPADPAWRDSEASVALVSRRPERIALDVRLPAEGVLVLFDTYEKGWHATVDGAAADVLRADAAFRGLRLPSGRHRVEFAYSARGLREGLLLGAAGLLATILVAMRLRPV